MHHGIEAETTEDGPYAREDASPLQEPASRALDVSRRVAAGTRDTSPELGGVV
jgi:hypothetical protein